MTLLSIKTRKAKPSKIFSILCLLLLIHAQFSCSKKKEENKAQTREDGAPLAVKVAPVTQGDISAEVEFVGNVLPDKQAVITSQVPGQVKKIFKREGEWVKKGTPLVSINPEYIDRGVTQAQSAVTAANATLNQAIIQRNLMEDDLKRISELYQRGAVSKEQYEKAEAAFKAAEENVRMAEAGLKQAKAVLGDAQSYKRETVIKAPFEGEIAKLLLEEGERIQTMPPTPILALVNYDEVDVQFSVSEREVGVISEGMPCSVILDAFPHSTIEAAVTRVVPVLDAATRTFTVKVRLNNKDHKIKPGMMARVILNVVYKNIITVHRDAVSLNNITGERRVVEVVDSKAVERMVDLGRSFGDRVEIVNLAGLQVGGLVIVSGASDIFTGTPVRIVETESGQ